MQCQIDFLANLAVWILINGLFPMKSDLAKIQIIQNSIEISVSLLSCLLLVK